MKKETVGSNRVSVNTYQIFVPGQEEPQIAFSIDVSPVNYPKLYIFDVEATCVTHPVGGKFRKFPADWKMRPGLRWVAEYITHDLGAKIALCTNQGGVAYGILPKEEMQDELEKLARQLDASLYVCYHHPFASGEKAIEELAIECSCRKPKPGMILQAMKDHGVLPDETLYFGDREEDRLAAAAAGVRYALVDDALPPLSEEELQEWNRQESEKKQ